MRTGHLWQHAAALAARAHRDQFRRDGRTPYFSHPARVALTVAAVFGCTEEIVLAAALLHDIVEDTRIDYDELLKNFGREVADIVSCLSKDKRMIETEREAEYDRRLAAGPWQARLIKLADVYDNLADTAGPDAVPPVLDRARRALRVAAADTRLAKAAEALRGAIRAAEAGSTTA